MKHELWVDPDGFDTFCLAGPGGDDARNLLLLGSMLEWVIEAGSHFEAMSKYYEYRGYGVYTSAYAELDKKAYG